MQTNKPQGQEWEHINQKDRDGVLPPATLEKTDTDPTSVSMGDYGS